MAKTPVRQRGAVHEGQYVKKLNNMYSSIDNYTKMLTESMLYDLRQATADRILAAGKSARLDACDDKIYDSYIQLMATYRQVESKYEAVCDVLVSPKIKSTLEGIYAVIKARLAAQEPHEAGFVDNPIFVEKKFIINDGINTFNKACEKLNKKFIAEQLISCQQNAREILMAEGKSYDEKGFEIAAGIAARQDELLYDQVYELYQDIVKSCIIRLNDLESREAILIYNDLLEQEQEILGSIVKIQIPLLEKGRSCSPMEETATESIVAAIQEGYDSLSACMSEISVSMREPKKNVLIDEQRSNTVELQKSEKAIMEVLAATNFNGFVKSHQTELAELNRTLEQEFGIAIEKDIASRNYARAMYEFRRTIAIHGFMAEEMIMVFEKVLQTGKEQLPGLEPSETSDADVDRAILEGIIETMEIKIESLKENKEQFETDAKDKMESLRPEKPQLSLADFAGINPLKNMEQKEVVIAAYRQKMQKHMQMHLDYANKKSMSFKKDCLLFEIITFEEIINYSITRIKDSPAKAVQNFVKCVDRAWTELQIILTKNDVIAIIPKPHDMFNGKEQEVLSAEKNPDYRKGEIIKLMNRGYKQGEMVLIRANVVAAL